MSTAVTDNDHYVVISSDCHAGASLDDQYREYLDPEVARRVRRVARPVQEPVPRPAAAHAARPQLGQRAALRRQDADGVVAEVIFPNTVPPFFPTGASIRGAADARGVRAPPRRHPRPQPLARRLLRRVPRAPGRHRPDLPQRRRRGDQGRRVAPPSTVCGRRAAARRVPDDATQIEPLYAPVYDKLWAACQDLDVIVNHHGGGGSPELRRLLRRHVHVPRRDDLLSPSEA